MTRQEGGRWETALALWPGRYQYKFVVDGQWMNDPNARENILNQHGSFNSVVEVQL
jgi:1,4-alpha-glucan branching enzyme